MGTDTRNQNIMENRHMLEIALLKALILQIGKLKSREGKRFAIIPRLLWQNWS